MKTLHIVVYTIFLVIILGAAISVVRANAHPSSLERIQEDDPAWNCKTMGNGVCAPNHSDPRFRLYDEAFNCFAEIDYTDPTASWNDRVMRCIPDVNAR